jgi:hypothetical protein
MDQSRFLLGFVVFNLYFLGNTLQVIVCTFVPSFGYNIICPSIYGLWLALLVSSNFSILRLSKLKRGIHLLYNSWVKIFYKLYKVKRARVRVMVFNPTLNNIATISWRSVLLVEETEVPGENHRPVASHSQTISHNVVSSLPRHERVSNSQL